MFWLVLITGFCVAYLAGALFYFLDSLGVFDRRSGLKAMISLAGASLVVVLPIVKDHTREISQVSEATDGYFLDGTYVPSSKIKLVWNDNVREKFTVSNGVYQRVSSFGMLPIEDENAEMLAVRPNGNGYLTIKKPKVLPEQIVALDSWYHGPIPEPTSFWQWEPKKGIKTGRIVIIASQ